MTANIESNFHFFGNQNVRDAAVEFVNKVLKEKGNFEEFADLSAGLEEITKKYRVEVTDDDDGYSVQVRSVADSNRELTFVVDRNTGTIYKQMESTDLSPEVDDEDMDFLDEI